MINLREILGKTFVADVEYHAAIGSTNDRAIERAASPSVKLPLLVLADCQTAGRGRGANRWWAGPGSLAFSLLIGPESGGAGGPRSSALVSLAAGVAVVEALAPLLPGHEIGIHWPNDVMLDGRKLAGILIEIPAGGRQVIGIGINTNNRSADAPEEVRPRVATLCDVTGRMHDATGLLIAILRRLERQVAELALAPEGVARRTHELCLQRGKRLQITQGEKQIEGCCLGIAADGALLLEVDGRQKAVYSGTVKP
jgi:BirA family biotin operon repressor/biotin-[acetyl-CoA-carboxylase] ligase